MWQIWIARIVEVLHKKPEGLQGTKARCSHQMKTYLCSEWKKRSEAAQRVGDESEKCRSNFEFDFGTNENVYEITDWSISIRNIPPELD